MRRLVAPSRPGLTLPRFRSEPNQYGRFRPQAEGCHNRVNVANRRILLKNSNFRGDHNSEDRWQPRGKFPWGLSGATDFSAYDPLLALAVASTRGDNAFRAEVGFSRHLNFRLFQQYRHKADIADRDDGRASWGTSAVQMRIIDAKGSGSRSRDGCSGAHSSGSPALISASRKPGGESIKPDKCASSPPTESLGFSFIASTNAAFASCGLSAAAWNAASAA